MARKLVIEVLVDPSQAAKGYAAAEKATRKFANQVEHASRGVAVATVGFHGLGRAIAYAGGTFAGFYGATRFIEGSIDAAREAAVAQRALAAQMRASGESFTQNKERIDQVALSYGRFGFQNDKVVESLTVLERGTGNINTAIRLQAVTADIARAKNIDLAAAANVVAKVFGGQETALRRAVPGLEKHAHGMDLIREAQKRVAGQAAANTTVQERFNATLHDTQEIIGRGLLPIVNQYLGQLTKWLDKMNRSGQLQKDVNKAVRDATPVFHSAGVAIGFAAGALGRYQNLLDKTREGAKSAKPQVRALSDVVRLLVDPGFGLGKATELANRLGKAFGLVGKQADYAGVAVGAFFHTIGQGQFGATRSPLLPRQIVTPGGRTDPFADAVDRPLPKPRRGATAEQRNSWFDAVIGRELTRAGYLTNLRKQIGAYKDVLAQLKARLAVTKDVTRQLTLEDQIASVQYQISQDIARIEQNQDDLDKRRAEAAKRRAEAARKHREALKKIAQENVKAAAERVRLINEAAVAQVKAIRAFSDRVKQQQVAREQAEVFGLLGLSPTGDQRTPSQGNLQAALKKAQAAIAGTPLDTKAMESRLSRLRDVINTEFSKLTRDTKIKVAEWLDALTGKSGDHPLTKAGAVGGRNLALMLSSGLHLSAAEMNRFEQNLNAQKLTAVTIDNHIHVDGREIARVATRGQQRDRYRTSRQTSGFRG